MGVVRCERGHFFDPDRFSTCPHCARMDEQFPPEIKTGVVTSPSDITKPDIGGNNGLSKVIDEVKNSNDPVDEQKTVGYFNKAIGSEPVVGWLVCVEGNHFGEDFKLKSGRNFVGRAKTMDIVLDGDAGISREKHAVILYEPKNNIFIAQPGDSRELFYLNDKVVLSSVELHPNDIITLGDTKLMFIPCCSDKFNWNDITGDKNESKNA